ncbi:CinA family protein [Microbacterium sp. A94]|uniref:CinA family protein n=1 Tax=Microbacterium sp. A94 TaxID=3450717 RepID=UPI003F43F9B0
MSDIARISAAARTAGLRIAVAESLTSGQLANTVGAGEKAGEWFAGGIVAYLRDVKEKLLGVTPGIDLCSAQCAEELARGAAAVFNADVCVSTTGVGGPDPEDGHQPGTVYIGWAARGTVGHLRLALPGDPPAVLDATVEAALRVLVARVERLAQ